MGVDIVRSPSPQVRSLLLCGKRKGCCIDLGRVCGEGGLFGLVLWAGLREVDEGVVVPVSAPLRLVGEVVATVSLCEVCEAELLLGTTGCCGYVRVWVSAAVTAVAVEFLAPLELPLGEVGDKR